jgi:hypothetical protein
VVASWVVLKIQIRAPDGLLQRYLAKNRTYGRNPKQGDMRRYWYEGNSENFIYLLYQMDKLEQKLLVANDGAADDDDNLDLSGNAREYFASFQEQAKDLWEQIVGPFSRGNEDDIGDFVAEEEEEVEGSIPHHLVDRQQQATAQEEERAENEELARYYIQKAGGNDDDEDDEIHYSEDDSLGDAHEEDAEPESAADQWAKDIRNKGRRGSQEKPTGANKRPIQGLTKSGGRRRLSRGDRNGAGAAEDSSSGAEELYDSAPQKGPTKRAILDDSDGD